MLSKIPIQRIICTFFFIFILPSIANATLLVSNWGHEVMKFNGVTGVFEGIFANGGGLGAPTDMAYGPDGNLYVASAGSDAILRYDGVTGAFISVASGGGIEFPTGITFGPDGNLYVSNPLGIFSDTVLRYDGTTGVFIDVFVSGVAGPQHLSFGPDGNLYVVSNLTNSVLRFDGTNGLLIDTFVSTGLNDPSGLAFGPDNNLYVSNRSPQEVTGEVMRYNGITGELLGIFASFGLTTPRGLTFGPDGDLYVADETNDAVLRYNGTTGDFISIFASGSNLTSPRDAIFSPIPEPNIIISPTPYDFGNVNIGNTSSPQTFTISNTGDSDLIIYNIDLTGTDPTEFAIQNDYCSAQIIPPAGNCTVDAVFLPTLEGAKSANLSIPSDDPDTPTLDTPLSGTGIGPAPDLIGQAQTFYTGNFGKDIFVELQIENIGNVDADSVDVLFVLWDGINAVPLDLKFIASGLLVGETTTVVSFHNSLESLSGKYLITFIDYNDVVVERDETNNMNIFSIP